jgi:Tfp pilus assembly protein PilX
VNHIRMKSQSGSALIISIVLLLLLSLVTFFAVRVSLSELGGATSDMRAKTAHRVAEAGLDQAIEYVRMNQATLLPLPGASPSGSWTRCGATDRNFPCGAIEPGKSNSTTRSNYFAFTGGADIVGNAASANVDVKSLPMGQTVTSVNNFPVTYNAGALLCLLDASTIGPGKSATCTIDATKSNTLAVTLVSTGQINGESARATVAETLGQYRIIRTPPGLPPVVSSSVISGLGTSTIVSNPDGGGPGVPLAVWTRSTIDPSGSFQTCQTHEYFQTGGSDSVINSDGVHSCMDSHDTTACSCPGSDQVSNHAIGEGKDMLDRQRTCQPTASPPITTDCDSGPNAPTDTVLSPTYNFPCDIFEYVFGVQARENLVDGDDYHDVPPLCETKVDADGNGQKDVDEFLTNPANFTPADNSTIETLAADGGFFYLAGGLNLNNATLGRPDAPVVLVVDSTYSPNNLNVYGLVFVRDPADVYATSGGGAGAAQWASGGGQNWVEGAVVIEGPGTINGNVDIVSSPELLKKIVNSPKNVKFARVPGTWTDIVTY